MHKKRDRISEDFWAKISVDDSSSKKSSATSFAGNSFDHDFKYPSLSRKEEVSECQV